jgi:hypothetical protein
MTYREILEESIRAMRIVANNGMPFSPASLHFYANWMEREMIENERRKPVTHSEPTLTEVGGRQHLGGKEYALVVDTKGHYGWREVAGPQQQAFWKCKHYPSAIDNFFRAEACEHGCHERQPTWDSNGVSV